jgi:3',5'-cyclic AMP phosphodiesterase CpdA
MAAIALAAAFAAAPAAAAPSSPINPLPAKAGVRFGVMSDTHIGGGELAGLSNETRLANAYRNFAGLDSTMDAIAVVGDLTDHGTLAEYTAFKAIMDANSPTRQNILSLGNHDNYEVSGQAVLDRFSGVFGGDATADSVVGGYHFITLSPTDRVYNTSTIGLYREWLDGRLSAAAAEDPTKPIFVFMHQTVVDTCIGSRQSQQDPASDVKDILAKYSQAVTFSGHSHVSVIDPRNIWQGDFTALNCGSVYYVALDYTNPLTAGQTDNTLIGYAPTNRGESSTSLVVDVSGSVVTVRRYDWYYEREIAPPFVFDASAPKAEFPYREEKRLLDSSAPEFAAGASVAISDLSKTSCAYAFPQANNTSADIQDDGAFAYAVSFAEAATGAVVDTARLQAGYYMADPPKSISFQTSKLSPGTAYTVSVAPIGFFGKRGAPLTSSFTTAGDIELVLKADSNLVRKGSYFRLNASFGNAVNGNAAIIGFKYDTSLFEFAGYEAKSGVSALSAERSADGVDITVMIPNYNATDLVDVILRVKEDVALSQNDSAISGEIKIAVRNDNGEKSILSTAGSTWVAGDGEGDVDGDGSVTLLDLSEIIDAFGKASSDPQWSALYKYWDFNGNGSIDVDDVVYVATRIEK